MTSWLFTSVGDELKPGTTVLPIQLVVRAGTKPGTLDANSSIFFNFKPCL